MGVASEMTCSEFDKAFDPYVDGVLDPASAAAARMHIESCRACDRAVARWQQSRILLSTAVAEIATAVDVSSILAAVTSALDADSHKDVPVPQRGASRQAQYERELGAERSGASSRADRRKARAARPVAKLGRFSSVRRFATVAGASAVAAAASILLLTPGTAPLELERIATNTTTSAHLDSSPWVKQVSFQTEAPSNDAGWRPLLPVPALVDALEPGEGHTVSTWVQPRTQARVIWVQSRDSGPTVQTAGYEK